MLVYRHQMLHLGVSPQLLAALDRAIEADVLLASALEDHTPASHPLGAWVMQRDLADLLTWPLHGRVPELIAALPAPNRPRRGPVAAAPELPAADRERFFTRMRATAEQATGGDQFLLRRQALYLAGYDRSPDTTDWLDHQQRSTHPEGWLDQWLNARSVASVGARQGDTDQITGFIATTLVDDDAGEAANLNYWAYWVGEIPDIQLDDTFMGTRSPDSWHGRRLLHHVTGRLDPKFGYLDLYVHTLWALLAARPQLLRDGSVNRSWLRERVEILLDSPGVSRQADRDLAGVRYALRLAEV
ncbi:transcriptional regulator [Streptacidiphilus cavernicola]|uniref:Transcriptional regulator n=1 Tax=Streptacidiphilus cavernicola TaxID=3342716 RepID=A0ABV6W5R5_9ACTN